MGVAIEVKVDLAAVANIRASLLTKHHALRKAAAGALNDTAKHESIAISKLIRQYVALPKTAVDDSIFVRRATPDNLVATVQVFKRKRISLRLFGAKQTDHGVKYKIEKTGPEKILPHAFILDSLGGSVYHRIGKSRLPIMKLMGPSPWGVYLKHGGPALSKADANAYLHNRLQHRLQYQTNLAD